MLVRVIADRSVSIFFQFSLPIAKVNIVLFITGKSELFCKNLPLKNSPVNIFNAIIVIIPQHNAVSSYVEDGETGEII